MGCPPTDPAWHRVEYSLAGGRLVVEHREGNAVWAEVALRYWRGEMPKLETVASSGWTVIHRGEVEGIAGVFYFKRFLLRDWRDILKHIVRASRARRALMRGEELRREGFLTPKPCCLIEETRGGIVRSSALVAEAFDAPSLLRWISGMPAVSNGSDKEKRDLLRAFAAELARMHESGWHHADARLGNILYRREGETWKFCWLDNEGAKKFAVLPRQLRVHNLMQVNMERTGLSLPDRLRFWRAYVRASGLPRGEARAIRKEAMAYTQRRWRKHGWL
jgi:hypothetical protein